MSDSWTRDSAAVGCWARTEDEPVPGAAEERDLSTTKRCSVSLPWMKSDGLDWTGL